MDYKHTIDILSENIKELDEIVSGFAGLEKIPAVDLDLVLDKTRNIYEVLLLLKKAVAGSSPGPTEPPKKVKAESLPEEMHSSNPEEPHLSKGEKTRKESDGGQDIMEPETPRSIDSKETPDTPDKIKEPDEDTPRILSDRFKKQTTSLNENMIQSKGIYDLSTRLQTKPISNIQNAIGLNDKFLFINELFDGETDKYNQTIEILNNATHFNEAYNYLVEKFQWDMDSEPVQKILDLIRRKLIVRKDE
ncbi:MAG: hypothetical protein JW723_02030 [Bacteroidales bacterium]|nr:hypothetical protein [Bacteroidales bacterium]